MFQLCQDKVIDVVLGPLFSQDLRNGGRQKWLSSPIAVFNDSSKTFWALATRLEPTWTSPAPASSPLWCENRLTLRLDGSHSSIE
jgi:hypothetical protein